MFKNYRKRYDVVLFSSSSNSITTPSLNVEKYCYQIYNITFIKVVKLFQILFSQFFDVYRPASNTIPGFYAYINTIFYTPKVFSQDRYFHDGIISIL